MKDLLTKLRMLWSRFLLPAFDAWQEEVWRKDLDQNYCCDGRECGCRGCSIRDVYTGYGP